MNQLVHNLALLAALAALCAGLWQDWGLLTTLKKVVVAYLGGYLLVSVMVLFVRSAARPAAVGGKSRTPAGNAADGEK